ncbi:hypothetical protein QJS10_CPB11g01776 [Acorus calamus]|uniref:Uncharacterized protein n=1 Tax=Acorus calamus TaxID=4465 RepID=A0AAV9DR71_ACOCL|nr:hypothetical protein QJS10_CPB11g01776 [Acorus calamus]
MWDVYFDDESAEVVISSLRLGDEQDSSNGTDEVAATENDNDEVVDTVTSDAIEPGPNIEEPEPNTGLDDDPKEGPTSSSPAEWVEWRETSDSGDPSEIGATEVVDLDSPTEPSPSSDNNAVEDGETPPPPPESTNAGEEGPSDSVDRDVEPDKETPEVVCG